LIDSRNLHGREIGTAVAAVTAVGRRLVTDPRWTERALSAVHALPVQRWWAVGDGLTVVVPPDVAVRAQRLLHDGLVDGGAG
ncbi:MAG: hypothetical protein D6798_05965, partial [Deltaproteobacteria bacterium]